MWYFLLTLISIVIGVYFVNKHIYKETEKELKKKLNIPVKNQIVNLPKQDKLTYDLNSSDYFSKLFLLNLQKNTTLYSVNKDNSEVIEKIKFIVFLLDKKSNLFLKPFRFTSEGEGYNSYKYQTCKDINTFIGLLKDKNDYLNTYFSFISKLNVLLGSSNFFSKEYSNGYLIASLSLFEAFRQVIENDSKEIVSEDYLDDLLKELKIVVKKSNFVNSKFVFLRDMKIDINDSTVIKAIKLFKS